MTFVGLTLGVGVMLISFGPGVFFLFAARWRRVRKGKGSGFLIFEFRFLIGEAVVESGGLVLTQTLLRQGFGEHGRGGAERGKEGDFF